MPMSGEVHWTSSHGLRCRVMRFPGPSSSATSWGWRHESFRPTSPTGISPTDMTSPTYRTSPKWPRPAEGGNMAALDDSRTLGRARTSFADVAEIDDFVRTLEAFERGELTPDQWRVFRVVRGTYGQRQPGDASMVRVKIPQGVLDAAQLRALADVGETYSRGFGHVTTRQNVQFHFVPLPELEKVMLDLADVGLTTREACGNSVRNVTACPWAGVAADEVFDVTPYAEALTRYFLRHRLSSSLPRKFKIGFEGCADDHVFTEINDIGWGAGAPRRTVFAARSDRGGRGRLRNGRRGFRVTAGGGTSILPRSGGVLYDFLPAGEMLAVAGAIRRVFYRPGG